MRYSDTIARKRDGGELSEAQIREFIGGVVSGDLADYQVSAWLMAAFVRGLSQDETLALTLAMRDSGERVDLSAIPGIKLDKHSSGGVGDKTTLVVVPILAAAGVPILKMSGRGLGFSGGTIDKLESIPGFRTDLSIDEARDQVQRIGAALVGQSPQLAPADKKLYALRDVTATVESIPLIAASIMSKKLAAGADVILLDVKVGRGAFMKDRIRARELAQMMVWIGKEAGIRTTAVLTAMDEPLGLSVGNALEVQEAWRTLTGKQPVDPRFKDLCVWLAGKGIELAGKTSDYSAAVTQADRLLSSGVAAAKFEEIVKSQGGKGLDRLPTAPVVHNVKSESAGVISGIDAEAIGRLAMEMGAGRARKKDSIDPAVGIELVKKTGQSVSFGDVIARLHSRTPQVAESHSTRVREAFSLTGADSTAIYEVIE